MVVERLRRQFIIINMSLVMLVLLIVFSLLAVSTYQKVVNYSYEFLYESMGKQLPQYSFKDEIKGEHLLLSSTTFFVIVDKKNNKMIVDSGNNTNESMPGNIDEIVQEVLTSGKQRGNLKQEDLRYVVSECKAEHSVIGFIDTERQMEFIYQQIFSYGIIILMAGIFFFIISYFLSKMLVKPVEIAFNTQKQFISDASHELKTPITVILTNLSILKKDQVNQEKWLGNIQSETQRMKKLVEGLLHLSRLDESSRNTLKVVVNLSDVVWESILLFEPVAFEKGLRIESNISENVYVKAIPQTIKQLIVIFLDNACKYSTVKGTITTTLTTSNNKVIFTINNPSEVINEDEIEQLFNRFYRVDKARSRQMNSYGLGLSLAKKIVDSHDGKIHVSNSEKEGTTFKIILNEVKNKNLNK